VTLVGFLGLGEAGSLIAADLAAAAMLDELGVAPRVAAASEAWLGEPAASR
jgi:3-hydroxyisobutyrate dehydrogenase-like beta-hydroxyacid dehydrogenase